MYFPRMYRLYGKIETWKLVFLNISKQEVFFPDTKEVIALGKLPWHKMKECLDHKYANGVTFSQLFSLDLSDC